MTMKFSSWIFGDLQTPPAMAQRTLWCVFHDDPQRLFSVPCTLNMDTVDDVKQRIYAKNQPYLAHIPHWELDLYSPRDVVNDTRKKDSLTPLHPRQAITAEFPVSKDPEVDIVIIQPPREHRLNDLAYRQPTTLRTEAHDPNECARVETVDALWNLLQANGRVHVRGTPASGKSTLARLLAAHVQQLRPDLPVYYCTWYPQLVPNTPRFQEALNSLLGQEADANYWKKAPLLLIIDEAQLSFTFTPLWNDLIKEIVPGGGPHIAIFSSYSSPSGWLWDTCTPTPVTTTEKQTISLRPSAENPTTSLFFSRPEFDDLIQRLCVYYSKGGLKFELQQDLQDYIWKLTCGQPSAVRTIVDGLNSSEVSLTQP